MNRLTRSRIKQQKSQSESNKRNPGTNQIKPQKIPQISDESSSESDIENYLKPAREIDLNSSFFQQSTVEKPFSEIEKNILGGVNTIKDDSESSENDEEEEEKTEGVVEEIQKINFEQMQEHLRKMEEAKKHVEQYEAKKRALKKKQKRKQKTDPVNVAELLIVGEKLAKNDAETLSEDFTSMSESEREDWEEVTEAKEREIIPKTGVEITVQMPGVIRAKKGVDLVAAMKRRLNRIKKENQVFVHKVSILCWIAHGNFVNNLVNNEKFLGLALSLIPSEQCYPADRTDLGYLEQILKWFTNTVQNLDKEDGGKIDLERQLHIDLSKKQASNKKILVLIFICILRALGIHCRLVMSLVVLPLRPANSELCSLSTKKVEEKKEEGSGEKSKENGVKQSKDAQKGNKTEKERPEIVAKKLKEAARSDKIKKEKSQNESKTSVNSRETSEKVSKPANKRSDSKSEKTTTKKRAHGTSESQSKETNTKNGENSQKPNKASEKTTKKVRFSSDLNRSKNKSALESQKSNTKPNLIRIKMSLRKKPEKIVQTDGAGDSETDQPSTSKTERPNLKKLQKRRIKSLPEYKEIDSEDEFCPRSPFVRKNQPVKVDLSKLKAKKRSSSSSPMKMDVKSDIMNLIKGRMSEEKQKTKAKLVKTTKKRVASDDDECPAPIKKKKHDSDDEFIASLKPKVKKRVQVKEEKEEVKRKGNDVWVEVYLEAEEKWISVDVVKKQVHCVNEIYKRATQPVSYVVAWDNKNYLKDISKRYCPNWNTITRKLRVDSKWWGETLRAFIGPKTARDREEDEELARLQLEKPLPTTISEYKSHPLYALKRHLLKFEAIYPPNAVTLGFVRNEPVYSRECVHTLHSREIWLKHAKVVRPGEKPYKIVKARPKYDRLSNAVITDQPLEIFGSWQVDDYVPPTAENGVVPRNEYGNVELFKTCMLPKGTVHLQLPGLNRVAKKLNIDCASAVVGFDFHSGWSHPMFDGFVVCEEFKETLIAAWEQEQEEAERRAQEKIEKRVYDNWKRLIKGLLIRERLKAKYDFGQPSTSGSSNKQKRKAKPVTVVAKKKR